MKSKKAKSEEQGAKSGKTGDGDVASPGNVAQESGTPLITPTMAVVAMTGDEGAKAAFLADEQPGDSKVAAP